MLFSLCMLLFGVTAGEGSNAGSVPLSIENSVEQLRKAMVEADSAMLDKLTAAELTYGHSNGLIENKAEFIRSLISGKYKFNSIELKNQQVIRSGDLAIVRHDFLAETHDQGKPVLHIRLHIMLAWKKYGSGWKLLARQSIKKAG
ncbi:MAG TPA: nuclear transport factor 2 family protein [Chitinophagaceae bacterium]|nr:nuclear transport factor 2 family protein [Chitinophagaceae bacterium]